jgi:hypothetical protein
MEIEMNLTARQLREARQKRIAARRVQADDKPAWLEKKIEEGEPSDPSDPSATGDGKELLEPSAAGDEPSPSDIPAATDEPSPSDLEPAAGEMPELPGALGADPSDPSDPSATGEDPSPSDLEPSKAAEDKEVKSAFMYNPLFQKPVALGPRGYKSGYHYFGPPPDAGTTYGYYLDADSKIGIVSPLTKGSKFSPVTGKPMKLMGKVDTDGLATVLAVSDQMVQFKVGKDTRVTSAPLLSIQSPKVFDALTGADISKTVSLLKAEDEIPMEPSKAADEPSDPSEPSVTGDEPSPLDLEPSKAADDPSEPSLPIAGDPVVEPVGQPGMPLQGEDDPSKEPSKAEDEPSDPSEETKAVQYEALQSVDAAGENLSEADVHMTLFGEDEVGGSPYWNVDVKGSPIARVYLKDQPKPDEIRDVFCSADYHRGVAGAIEKVGLKPVLKQLKAHLWANEIEKTKLAQGIKAKVEGEAKARVTALTKNLMKDLMNRIAIVCAGMDKNFYRETGNPLKESLWTELNAFGITNPSPIIEAAFRRGSTQYFETVLSKALEYMEMQPEALEQVKSAIGDMDVLPAAGESVGDGLPEGMVEPEQAPTLSQRLAASSVAVAGIPTVVGNAFGDHKKALRQELRLSGAGPKIRR